MPYPVESKNIRLYMNLDEDECRHLISVWQTSRNTKHVLRRLRDCPDFYDTRTVWVDETWKQVDNPHYDRDLSRRYYALVKDLLYSDFSGRRRARETVLAGTSADWGDSPHMDRVGVVDVEAHKEAIPLDVRWLRGQVRRLRKLGVPLQKLKTPYSDSELQVNADGLRNLAISLAS